MRKHIVTWEKLPPRQKKKKFKQELEGECSGPTYAQTRCFDRKDCVWDGKAFFHLFSIKYSHGVASMEMRWCTVTDVCASTSVSFLFLEQSLK